MHSIAFPEINAYRGLILAEESAENNLREQALEQVLIKISGNVDIIKLDESKALKRKISSMLAQFGYQNIAGKRYYYAQFDQRKIDDALMDMQQPIWGDTRPTPLIWLVNERRKITSEHMINSSQDSAVSWGLKKTELRRGISAQFPLIDLDDSLAIASSDISGRFYQTVAKASRRYDAEYFVIANITKTRDKKWQLKWELVHYATQGKQSNVLISQTNSGSKSYVMAAMLNEIADYYAQQFAILESNGKKLTQILSIHHIDSLANLIHLNAVLESLNAIDAFEVVKISEHKVEVLITLKGGLISLGNALNAQYNLQSDLSTASPFNYNWLP